MSEKELPPGWTSVSLGEIISPRYGKALPKSERDDDYSYPIIGSAGMMGRSASALVANPCIVLGRKGNIGHPQIYHAGCWPIDTTYYIVPPEGIDIKFLYYQLASIDWSKMDSSTAAPSLRREDLESVRLNIPPFPEQERIVDALEDHLSRLDNGVSTISNVNVRIDRLIGSIYQRALQGHFSERVASDEFISSSYVDELNSRLRNRKFKHAPAMQFSEYSAPKNWSMISMGDLSYDSGYGTSIKCDYTATGVPVLRIPNVQNGIIDLNDIKHAMDDSTDLNRYFLSPGDALFVRTNGSRNLIGRVGIVEKLLNYAFASYLVRFRFFTELVEPRWIQIVTQSPLWRANIEKLAASSAGQYNLNIKSLSQIPIPLPPLSTQNEIISRIDELCSVVDQMKNQVVYTTARSSRLRESLLRRAFSGNLVSQDPSDESAAALLERIRAERAAQVKPKRGRRSVKTATAPRPAPGISSGPAGTFVQEELGI